jgi:hypothetical protein
MKNFLVVLVILFVGIIFFRVSQNNKCSESELNLAFEKGKKIGYAIGCQETRKQIASDMHKLGVDPTILVSDHPSIPAKEIYYFYENH